MAVPKKSEIKELFAYVKEIGLDKFKESQPAKDLVAAWRAGSLPLSLEQVKDKIDAALGGKSMSAAGRAIRMTSKEAEAEANRILARDKKSASGKSVNLKEAQGSSGTNASGEEYNRIATIADKGSDATNPAKILEDAEEAAAQVQAVWTDAARSNRIKALNAVAGKLGFAGQTPGDMLDAFEDHLEALKNQIRTPVVEREIAKWTQNRDRLERLIRDDPESISFWEKQGEPSKIADNFEPISARERKAMNMARATLWKGEPKFDTTSAPPTSTSSPTGGSTPTGTSPPPTPANLDDAYAAAIRAAKATGDPVSVANIQKWTNLKSADATTIMARMHDEKLLGPPGKGGRRLIEVETPVGDVPPPDAPAPKDVAPTGGVAPQKSSTPGRFDKFFGGMKKAAAVEKAGLAETGELLSKGKLLKGLGRGLGTWTGGAAIALGPMMLGGAIRRGLEANPWGESESAAQDRETLRMGMDPGDLLNRVRLQELQKQSAMQVLMSNPQLQAALQRQIQGRQIMKTGKLPGDIVIGGSLDSGPFDDPEGLMALMQGR